MYGLSIELMFKNNFLHIYKEFIVDKTILLERANKYNLLTPWVQKNSRRLGNKNLQDLQSSFILDHLYKIDFALALGAVNLGVQITVNSDRLEEKLKTLKKFKEQGVYESIGITQVVLLHIVDLSEGRLWSKDEINNQLFDCIDFAFDCPEVRIFTLVIPK